MDAINASATKREAAIMLGVTASHISSVVHGSGSRELVDAWAALPADGAFAGNAAIVPKPSMTQALADALIHRACQEAPIDATTSQRENVAVLILTTFRLAGAMALPRGWTLSIITAFKAAGHPNPPSAATLRWYRSRLKQDVHFCSDNPMAAWAASLLPQSNLASAPTRAAKPKTKKQSPKRQAVVEAPSVGELVDEACGDCPIDPERSERDGAILLMLAMYNITGSLDWGPGWATAIVSALERADALPPTRAQLCLYRQQLANDPEQFLDIEGVDHQLIHDLLTL